MKRFCRSLLWLITSALVFVDCGEAQTSTPITIQQAVSSGKVDVSFSGTGASSGDSIKVKVKKRPAAGRGPVDITVPPGTILESKTAGYQNMMVTGVSGRVPAGSGGGASDGSSYSPTSEITLNGPGEQSYILKAYCAQFEKENPTERVGFQLREPVPVMACLAKEGKTLSVGAMQAAVWMQTDNVTYAKMSAKFMISQKEWDQARASWQRCLANVSNSEPGQSVREGMDEFRAYEAINTFPTDSKGGIAELRELVRQFHDRWPNSPLIETVNLRYRELRIIHVTRGMEAIVKKKNYSEAIAIFSAVIRADDNEPNAFAGRALAYLKINDFENAVADFGKAIALDSNVAEWYVDRGSCWSSIGNSSRALADYDRAIELGSALEKQDDRRGRILSESYAQRGQLLWDRGDKLGAIESYKEAIAHGAPSSVSAWLIYTCKKVQSETGRRPVGCP